MPFESRHRSSPLSSRTSIQDGGARCRRSTSRSDNTLMPLRKSDRDALYGICAIVVPFVMHTLILSLFSKLNLPEAPPLTVTMLEVALSIFAGFAFVIRGWPTQAGILFFWYVPLMFVGLWFYTSQFI